MQTIPNKPVAADSKAVAPEWQAQFEALPADPLRARAFELFAQDGLPHRRMEAWRWTDMRTPPPALETDKPALLPGNPVAKASGAVFELKNGVLTSPDTLPDGVRLTDISMDWPKTLTPMASLAMAIAPTRMRVEIHKDLSEPLIFRFEEAGFAHVEIWLAAGVSARLIESHIIENADQLASTYTQVRLEDKANLSRAVFQAGHASARQADCLCFEAGSHASYTQTILSCGAGLSRLETQGVLSGEHAQCTLNAAYIAGPACHTDLTSHIQFAAPHCTARQTIRGIVAKKGRGVFQGKFKVDHGAQKTDAAMHHAGMLLSEQAEINARPELEIYADDVVCAHGNAIGALDQAVIYYMRQRGLSEKEARYLLASGFAKEALDTLSLDAHTHENFLLEAESWLIACL